MLSRRCTGRIRQPWEVEPVCGTTIDQDAGGEPIGLQLKPA